MYNTVAYNGMKCKLQLISASGLVLLVLFTCLLHDGKSVRFPMFPLFSVVFHFPASWFMPATHAQETCICTRNLTQVHHSFVHNNNWPANHVARFVSRAGQFLSWNKAVLSCVQETCTRKKLVQDWPICTRASLLYKTTCTSFWYKFLERVWCVAGIGRHRVCVRWCYPSIHPSFITPKQHIT